MNKFIDKTSVAGGTVTLNPPPLGVVGNCGSAAGNLVANCGFETGNTNNWTGSNFVGGYNVVVTSPANTGSYAMRMGNYNTQGSAVLSQTITDTPGVSYTFSFYLYSQSSGSVKSFQAIWNNTTLLNLGPTINSAFGWTQYAFTVTGTGSDTITFKAISDPGYFYIDDVAVTSVAPNGVIPGGTLASDLETVTFSGVILATNTSYTATVAGLKDVDGNTMAPYPWTFATGVTSTQLVTAGTIAIAPTNANVVLTLSAPVDANTINNNSIRVFDNTVAGGSYSLPGTLAISNGGQTITFTPAVPFANNHQICVYASYYVYLYDIAGNPFNNNTECSSVTNAADTTPPTVLTITPADGSTGIGPNNPITVIFSKPMNPNSFNNGNVGLYTGSTPVTSGVSASRDTTAFTFNNSTLSYGTTYTVVLTPGVADLSGNHLAVQVASSFSTMAAPATASPVEQTSAGCNLCATGFRPGAGATSVNPANPVTFFISAPLNPSSVIVGTANTSGTMYVAQNGVLFDGSVTLSSNNQVITFTPSGGSFTPGVVVSVYLTSGITDAFGNALTAYSASFTVAPATVNTAPVLTAMVPSNGSSGMLAPNATNVSVGSAATPTVIQINLSSPVDPLSVSQTSFQVFRTNNSNYPVSGTVAIGANGSILTFTPTGPLPANTTIFVYASYTSALKDLAGNNFNCLCGAQFSTGNAASHAPQVISVTPADNSTGNGPNTVVSLVFNEALNQNYINAANFALYNGYSNLNASIGYSVDRRIVTLSYSSLPYSTPIMVLAGTGVQDLDGNHLAAPFTSTFTTIPKPVIATPSVIQVRPASGASGVDLNAPITLYTNSPVNPATVNSTSVVVIENGIAVPGSFAVGTAPATSEGQTIVFTPANPFTGNGLVQVFLTSTVTDDWGNAFTAYSAQFNTVAQPTDPTLTGPTLTGISPSNGSTSPLNSVVVATFDQAIASGANTDNFYLLVNNSGSPVGVSVNQIAPNMLELIPGTLAPNTYYYVHLTGIQNVNGLGLNVSSSSYFYTGGAADSTAPVVNSVAPTNGATNVGGNAILEFTFNEVVDTYTINTGTVTLTANGNPVPFTLSFGGSYNYNNPGTSVSLTPEIPLPDSASVTLKISVGGTILNLAGAAVPEVDVTFTTGPGPDFTAPYIVSESPNYNGPGQQQNYIQTNSTFVFVFNEPLSPNSVFNNPNVSLYNYGTSFYIPAGVSLSPDGTTITFSPGPLTVGVQYRPCMYNLYDLAANLWNGTCAYFTTAAGGSATPQVIYTTPINGATNVPTNGLIEVAFNELVSGRTLGQIMLTPTSPAGAAMPVTASLVFDGTVVRITPASLLAPNTTYQLSVAGVTDFSGANAVTSQTIGFTTGANPQIGSGSTSFTSANVMVYNGTSTQLPNYTNPGVTNVDSTQPITLTFSGPIEEASLFGGYAVRLYTTLGGPSTSVPFTFALSNGGSTVAIVPNSALASGTEYTLTVNYNGTIYDQAGYAVANGPYFYFTTH